MRAAQSHTPPWRLLSDAAHTESLTAGCYYLHTHTHIDALPLTSYRHQLTMYPPQFQAKGLNYGFVEYDDPLAAERAMATLNGRRVHQSVRGCHIRRAASVLTRIRKSVSTGLTNPTTPTRKTHRITSTSSSVISPMRSMTRSCSRPSPPLAVSRKLA